MDLREDKSVLLSRIQFELNRNGSVEELMRLIREIFENEDYFRTAHSGSRELVTLMMRTLLGLNEEDLCVNFTVRLHKITIPFLEQANSSSEKQSKMVLDVIEEIYRGEVLADYLLFVNETSWEIAQQLNSVSNHDNVLTWIRRLSNAHRVSPDTARGKLNYLKYSEV